MTTAECERGERRQKRGECERGEMGRREELFLSAVLLRLQVILVHRHCKLTTPATFSSNLTLVFCRQRFTMASAYQNYDFNTMAMAFCGFFIVWVLARVMFRPKKSKNGNILSVDEQIVSLVHCFCILPRSISVAVLTNWADLEEFYAFLPYVQTTFAISSGYFLWDILACLYLKNGIQFLAHGILCFALYVMGQHPFLHSFGNLFLLFELSTPFLNLRRLLSYMDKQNTVIFDVNQKCFGLFFFLFRIVFGVPLSAYFQYSAWHWIMSDTPKPSVHSYFVVCFNMLANVILNVLNIWWLYLLILKALEQKPKAK